MQESQLTRRYRLTAILAAVLAAAATPVPGQELPSKPITIIVPFPAGGIADSSVRAVAARMAENMGQPVVVDNRAGAGGQVGATAAKQAKADGTTLFLANVGTHAINRTLYSRLSYDPVKDFEPVTSLFSWTHVLVVPNESPAKTASALVLQARSRPGQLTYASQGTGSGGHLLGDQFKAKAQIDATHVPYRGTAQIMPDILTGRVDFFFDGVGIVPFVKDGKVRALAVAENKRLPALPDVPTMAEAGFPGVELSAWFGIVVPAGTPRPAIARLNQEIAKAARAPDVVRKLADASINISTSSPEQFAAFMASETERLGKVVKSSGASAD